MFSFWWIDRENFLLNLRTIEENMEIATIKLKGDQGLLTKRLVVKLQEGRSFHCSQRLQTCEKCVVEFRIWLWTHASFGSGQSPIQTFKDHSQGVRGAGVPSRQESRFFWVDIWLLRTIVCNFDSLCEAQLLFEIILCEIQIDHDNILKNVVETPM